MVDVVLEAQKTYIRSVLEHLKAEPTTLAKRAGLAPSTLNRPLNERHWPHRVSLRTLSKLAEISGLPIPAAALGAPVEERESLKPAATQINSPVMSDAEPDQGAEIFETEVRRPSTPIPLPDFHNWPKDLPIRGSASHGDGDGEFYFNGDVVDHKRRPPVFVGVKDAFGLFANGDSMSPLYETGDTVWVHPGRPVTPGCYVLVELHPAKGEPTGAALVKQLVRRTADKLILRQFRPEKEITIPMKRVHRIYRVILQKEWEG